MVKTPMSRTLNHPAHRGQSFVAIASSTPIPKNSSRSIAGTSHTKCRVIRYSRLVELRDRYATLVKTSSSPPARPHHAESRRTSSGPSLGLESAPGNAFLGVGIIG